MRRIARVEPAEPAAHSLALREKIKRWQ